MARTQASLARLVGLMTVAAIVVALAVFLLITWLEGDPTNNLKEHQPKPSPSSAEIVQPAGGQGAQELSSRAAVSRSATRPA